MKKLADKLTPLQIAALKDCISQQLIELSPRMGPFKNIEEAKERFFKDQIDPLVESFK